MTYAEGAGVWRLIAVSPTDTIYLFFGGVCYILLRQNENRYQVNVCYWIITQSFIILHTSNQVTARDFKRNSK